MRWDSVDAAVDAHLERWQAADRGVDAFGGTARPTAINRINASDFASRWVVFAQSYGHPQPDGTIAPAVLERNAATDGTTIVGREQFDTPWRQTYIQAAGLAQGEHDMLSRAVSHFVSADVLDELDDAVTTIDNEPLFATDLFTPYGFAVFETPLVIGDLDPDTGAPTDEIRMPIRAIGWRYLDRVGAMRDGQRVEIPGVQLYTYTTPGDYEAIFVPSLRAYTGDPDAGFSGGLLPRDGLLVADVLPWSFGSEWEARNDPAHRWHTVPTPVAYMRRWFLAFMRFCWQDVVVAERDRVDRATARRWDRAARRKALLDYTTLRLRRLSVPGDGDTGDGVPLEHRVLVRGHWRRQWYRSLGPARDTNGDMVAASHRLVWIEPHWRGPDDGEIGAMHHATAVTRTGRNVR